MPTSRPAFGFMPTVSIYMPSAVFLSSSVVAMTKAAAIKTGVGMTTPGIKPPMYLNDSIRT